MTTTSAPVARKNSYPGFCAKCKARVAASEGFILKPASSWLTYCKECYPHPVVVASASAAPVRELTADGLIRTPYEPENLNLLRSFPAAKWDGDRRAWRVSVAPADIRRTLELADRLGLTVPQTLRDRAAGAAESLVRPHGTVPSGLKLYPYQTEGIKFLASNDHALLLDEPGVGKTIQALIALPPADQCRAVFVVPNLVKFNWRNECAKWRPDLRPVVLSGKGSLRTPEVGEVLIINPDVLPDAIPVGWAEAKIVLCADEAHAYKNYKAARTQKFRRLAEAAGRVWLLTGTPITNRPFDLYSLLQAAGDSCLKKVFATFSQFVRGFDGQKDDWGGWSWGKPAPWVSEKLRSVSLRRLKSDVLADLPTKVRQDIEVELPKSAKKALDAVWAEYGDAWEVADEDAAPQSLPGFEDFSRVRAELAEAKIDAVEALIEGYEDAGEPIVVFSVHRSVVEQIGSRDGWATITGSVAAEQRTELVRRFQAGELKGIALTVAAGGVGITLTRASTVIFADLDWTPALNVQAEDRCHRIGASGSSVNIIRLVFDHPLERRVHALLAWKIELHAAALDQGPLAAKLPRDAVEVASQAGQAQNETAEQFQARIARLEARLVAQRAEELALAKGKAQAKAALILEREKAKVKEDAKPVVSEITPEIADAIRGAIRFLADVCDGAEKRDGQGFNKPDAFLGQILAASELDTESSLRAAWLVAVRYKRQIKDAGFKILV